MQRVRHVLKSPRHGHNKQTYSFIKLVNAGVVGKRGVAVLPVYSKAAISLMSLQEKGQRYVLACLLIQFAQTLADMNDDGSECMSRLQRRNAWCLYKHTHTHTHTHIDIRTHTNL